MTMHLARGLPNTKQKLKEKLTLHEGLERTEHRHWKTQATYYGIV